MLHPQRLTRRALDGAFGAAEVPSLLLRAALYGHSGRLELTQGDDVRAFTFTRGWFVAAETTVPAEAFEHFLEQLVAKNDPRLAAATEEAHRTERPFVDILREKTSLDPSTLDAAQRAQARHVVLGAVTAGDAVAWFERRVHEEESPPPLDLQMFAAVWEAILRRYSEAELRDFARRITATLRINDAAAGFLRQADADPALLRLCGAPQAAPESDLDGVGALALCGLILAGEPSIAPPVPQPLVPPAEDATAVPDAALWREASALLQAHRAIDALPLLLRASELDPTHPLVYRSLGIAYTLVGNRDAAASAYRRYLELQPEAEDRIEISRWLDRLDAPKR